MYYENPENIEPIISVKGLGKKYRIKPNVNTKITFFSNFLLKFKYLIGGDFASLIGNTEDFWAIKKISFNVKKGEALGIIGKNGSGKSTLLRVLSGITEPEEGEALIRGKIGSLLQVGAGFNNELTGEENIYLNGTILGLSIKEIKEKFEEIVEFSEIRKFLKMPVKSYSSGMRVKLGFSIAINLDPDILLLDEVFAVGDLTFREKCMLRLKEELLKGRTVLFVSHNMGQIENLVDRCIILDEGKVSYEGFPNTAIKKYLQDSSSAPGELFFSKQTDLEIQIDKMVILDDSRKVTSKLSIYETFTVRIEYTIYKELAVEHTIMVGFSSDTGFPISEFQSNNFLETTIPKETGNYFIEIVIPKNIVNPQVFHIRPSITRLSPTNKRKAIFNHLYVGQYSKVELIDPEIDAKIINPNRAKPLLEIDFNVKSGKL